MDLAAIKITADTGSLDQGELALKKFTAAGAAAEKQAEALGTASNRAKQYSTQVGKASQHTANLGYQLNDIAVMLAAGQNPFMLAMQQGTQINQIWGQLGGGAGAVKSLGVAMKQMLSPLNVATIGIIAFGAAGVQSLMKLVGAGVDVSKSIESMTAAIEAFEQATENAARPMDEMVEEFGRMSPVMQQVLRDFAEFERLRAMEELNVAVEDTAQSINKFLIPAGQDAARVLNEATDRLKYRGVVLEFQTLREVLRDTAAEDETRLNAALRMQEIMREQVGEQEAMNAEQRGFYNNLGKIIADYARLGVISTSFNEDTSAAYKSIVNAGTALYEQLKEQVGERSKILQSAYEEIAIKRQEAELARTAAIYGKESQQYQELEVQAAERAARAYAKKNNLTADTTAELVVAYRESVKVTHQTDSWTQGMANVKSELQAILSMFASLGGGLLSNAAKRVEIDALKAGKSMAEARMAAEEYKASVEFDARRAGTTNIFEKMAIDAEESVFRTGLALDMQLENQRKLAREAAKSASKSGREYGKDLESLQEELMTERQLLDQWYAEGQALLADRRAQELLTKEEHQAALLALDEKYAADTVELKRQEASHVLNAQTAMYSELGNLMGILGQKSKAAAIASIAINTALRVRETLQNTAAASVRALAELGPIAGPPAAAKISAYGKAQAAMIAAGGVLQAGMSLSGDNSGGGSSSLSGGTFNDISGGDVPDEYTIRVQNIDPDGLYSGRFIQSLTTQIQEELGNKGLIRWDWQE